MAMTAGQRGSGASFCAASPSLGSGCELGLSMRDRSKPGASENRDECTTITSDCGKVGMLSQSGEQESIPGAQNETHAVGTPRGSMPDCQSPVDNHAHSECRRSSVALWSPNSARSARGSPPPLSHRHHPILHTLRPAHPI